MRQGIKTANFHNESAETRGTELEKTYSKILGGRIVGGENDGGVDIRFDNVKGLGLVQIKSSWTFAKQSLSKSVQFREFIPIIVGDPGQHTREEILDSVIEKGGWAGVDVEDREKVIQQISNARELILVELRGVQKGEK